MALGETSNDANYSVCQSQDIITRTTSNLDDELLADAIFLTGMQEKAVLIREALKALVEREAAHRLARLGGTEPDIKPIPRRRIVA